MPENTDPIVSDIPLSYRQCRNLVETAFSVVPAIRNDDVLDPIVAGFVAGMTRDEALAYFTAADVTVGPVLDISDLVGHPYVEGRGVLAEYPDAEVGRLPMHHVSPQLSGTPGAIHSPAPDLGQHTAEILARLGLDGDALDRLRQQGIV